MTDAPPGSPPWGPGAGITIRGGEGPSVADLDELRATARALRSAAEHLQDAAAHVGAAWQEVEVGEGDSMDTARTARAARDAIEPLLRGPASLAACAVAAQDLARGLGCAADLYGAAENRAAEVARTLLAAQGSSIGDQPLVAALGAVVAARVLVGGAAFTVAGRAVCGPRVPTLKDLALAVPAEPATLLLASVLRGLAPGWHGPDPDPVPDAAGLVVAGGAVGSLAVPSLRRRPLEVTPRLGATTGPAPVDAAGVLSDVGALYPVSGGPPGTIGVERLDRPDGSRAWVVAIPGTQAVAGSNPMDMQTNVRLMAGAANDGTDLVERALAQAGVAPGEPVLLAGHSQGGMVAMALAGNAAFIARYHVAAVLTAGSPVAAQSVPAAIPVLHLEHRQDLVPALDGRPEPALANRTTAVRDLAASSDPADRAAVHDPVEAHGIDTYVRTAAAVSATGAQPVRVWEKAADQVLGGPGTRSVRMEFTGTRLDLPVPAPRGRTLAPGPLGADPFSLSGSLR